MNNFITAFKKVSELADDFRKNEKRYLSPEYQEIEVRRDYIDKFFEALGWDISQHTKKSLRAGSKSRKRSKHWERPEACGLCIFHNARISSAEVLCRSEKAEQKSEKRRRLFPDNTLWMECKNTNCSSDRFSGVSHSRLQVQTKYKKRSRKPESQIIFIYRLYK